VEILEPLTFAFLLIGAMLPYWFSAMTMKSVGKAAMEVQYGCFTWLKSMPTLLLRACNLFGVLMYVCVINVCMYVSDGTRSAASVLRKARAAGQKQQGAPELREMRAHFHQRRPQVSVYQCLLSYIHTYIHTFIHGNIWILLYNSITVKHLHIHSVCIHITYIHAYIHTNREMIAPAALVLLSPLVAGTFFGVHAVYGLLTGALLSGEGIHTHTYTYIQIIIVVVSTHTYMR
jgi:hypothetical protein